MPENYTVDNALITNIQLSYSISAFQNDLAPVIKGDAIKLFSQS